MSAPRWPRASTLFLAVLALGLLEGWRPARAQGTPQVQVQVDADTVGVGDALRLRLTAQSSQGMPEDPALGPTPGFLVRGQTGSSPTQTHMNINGVQSDHYGLTVEWTLQAQRTGTFALGPASVVVGGARYSGRAVTVRVVPAGQAPQRPPPMVQPQSPFNFSPFDPWKGLFPGWNQPDQQPPQPPQPPAVNLDPRLALDAARGDLLFLHATVDKTSAVIGEQVLFSVYLYVEASSGNIDLDDADYHDPSVADFVRHPLQKDDQDAPRVGYASIGGRIWDVKLWRRWALFPLRAGDLDIGSMNMTIVRPRSAAGKRTSEVLRVHVTEPPLAGRPPGYALGDVGRFALQAQVTPREVDQGGAVGVHVEVSGTGNVPGAIATPARTGVEWLVPEVHEELGPVGHDAFGGKRTFDFVVRVRKAGDVDLGEIALPYWDPEQRRYQVARAPLGVVGAKASPVAAAGASGDPARDDALPGLPPARDALEGTRPPRPHWDDSPYFWLAGIGGWPLAVGVAVAGRAAARRTHAAWRARRASPAAELRERVAAANAACGLTDGRSADAAIARALEAATVAHAGVSVRGAVGTEVVDRLERAGVRHEAAERFADLLRECEAARFAPEAADVVVARDRWVRAQGAIRQLERRG
jgi:hypothetical protein